MCVILKLLTTSNLNTQNKIVYKLMVILRTETVVLVAGRVLWYWVILLTYV